MDLMSSGGGGAALDHRDMDGPDHCIPSTPRKTTTFIPDLNCHEEIADFEDILDVPVALLTPFPEKSASGKIVSPPLAPVTPCNDSSEGLGGKKRGGEEFGELHTVEVGEGMGLCSDQSAKSVASDSCESERNEDEEMEEIDLNKMPKKKAVRRKKHRPKVVFEDKPVRSSKSVTPKRARSSKSVTSKRASARKKKGSVSLDTPDKCEESKGQLIPKNVHVRKEKAFSAVDTPSIEVGRNKAKLAVEKTYVRKKKVLSSLDTPDKTEKTKLLEKTYVRRKKASNASTITDLCGASAVGEIVEGFPLKKRRSVRRCLSFSVEDEATNGLTTRFSTEFAAKSPAGIAFDLNHSLNQGLDEYLRLSVDPTSSNLSSKSGMEHLEAPDRSRKTVNSIGMQSDSDGCINAILTDDAIEKTGTKREHDLVDDIQHCCINESSRDVCFVNGDKEVKKTSFWQETGNLIQYFPIVHKKRRTERGKTWGSNRAVANNFRYHSFADVQRSTRLNGLRQSELILSIDRIPRVTRKRSKIPNRARKLTTLSILDDCSHLLWYPQKTKESLYESENKSYESQTCLEALAADTRFKITTKRPRNKVNYNLVRSLSFNSAKKCETTLSNFSVLGQHFVIGLSASTAGNWKNLKTESNFGRSFYSSFQSQAVVSYMGPVENIVNKMKHLKIIEDTEDEVESIEKMHNALIPYGGGSMMVPYRNLFDQIKKRRPRAKVVLDPETNRVWNMLMGKKHNNEADDLDMDKEKKWEEERKVFRGRAELFIARMHLILGDRRFSKWKGSVVDSVVGVFLTQNVSDHLSSSAFMSLAAKYPLRSRGHSREANDEKMKRKQEDGSILDSGNSINSQEKKVVPEENDPGSEIHDLENEAAEVRISLGRDDKSGTDCSEGRDQEIDIDSTQDGEDEQVTAFGNIILEETVDKMSMEDLISSQNSVITSENFSENLIQTTHVAEDLILKNKCIGLDCPATIVELILNRESNKTDESYKNGDWVPTPENIGAVDEEKNCINIEMENRFSDKMDGLGNDLEIMKTFDNKILEENSFPSTSGQLTEVEPHALGSKLCVQTSICSETEIFLEKHYSCQDNHSNEKFEDSLGESIFHECPQVEDEHTVKVHPKGMNSDFKAENSHRVLCREQAKYMRSHNELEEAREPVKITESNLKNETCSSEYIHSERLEGISEARYVNNVYEKKTKNYWESLRKEASVNERSSDELDSLDWEAVRNADVNEIARVIRERGMNNVLAQRIKDFLNRLVKDHGSIDLEWLKNIPPEEVKDYLLSIRGLGIKSVECVRLLTLQHLAFPVDTNVGRICVRLGWVPLQPLPESLQLHLLELYPMIEHIQKYLWPRLCHLDQKTLYELHYQMITFGKVFCTKTKPNCNACPMRGDCKHFASAFASARLALPGPEEKQIAISRNPFTFENDRKPGFTSILQPLLEGSQLTRGSVRNNCEPIIEEPTTPEHEFIESLKSDIEDAFFEDPEEIPTIKLSLDEFKNNLISYMQENNVQVEDDDMSKALVAVTADVASIPMPKLKNISRLRTEHQVYELPDSHPLLEGIDQRVPDDPCPYLLAIWTPGETAQSTEPPQSCCNSQGSAKLCDNKTCFACNSIREAQAQTVRGTLLIPCRTAMRGSFPLNGTYFQVNEVFADHSSSHMPIDVPREWIWNLPRRTVFFGSSISTIFRGLTTEGIQHCFWRGFVCVRGFDRSSRAPKPLYARLHFPPSKAVNKNKKTPE